MYYISKKADTREVARYRLGEDLLKWKFDKIMMSETTMSEDSDGEQVP